MGDCYISIQYSDAGGWYAIFYCRDNLDPKWWYPYKLIYKTYLRDTVNFAKRWRDDLVKYPEKCKILIDRKSYHLANNYHRYLAQQEERAVNY